MSTRSIGWMGGTMALVLVSSVVARQDQAFQDVPAGPDVLTRGPVHEAYAEPVVFDPRPGVVISQAPPDPVEELPPDQRPEGYAVEWISGYWAWDDDRADFIWISGIWRDIPPGRQWMPGYWSEVEGGYQWTSGFWAPDDQEEIEYLPPPPETLEIGANTPAPSAEHVWAPGCWYWQEQRYVWTPGYWVEYQPNWVWIPPTYIPTPSGCIFVPGYWDYTLANRGLLFAPVYIERVVYTQPDFVYTPTVTIDSVALTDHFFCRPRYRHYYFGDYYAAGPAPEIQPWFEFQQSRTWYDPIYVHQRVVSVRQDPTWETRVREEYRYRTVHVDARPARTFLAQQALVARRQDAGPGRQVLARTLAQVARQDNARIRLERVDRAHHAELARRQQELQRFREQRVRLEAETPARRQEKRERLIVRKREMLKSPVAARVPQERPKAARPFRDARPGGPAADALTDPLGDVPGGPGPRARQGRPRPEVPKQPRPERPKAQPGPRSLPPGLDLPKAQPKRERPRDLPKAERFRDQPGPGSIPPGLDLPKAQPKRERPRDLPKAERFRTQPDPGLIPPGLDRPQAQPKRERPRDLPKAQPGPRSIPPGLDFPPAQPKRERPNLQPGPRPPQAKPERPKAQPKREQPKRQPAANFAAPGGPGPVIPFGSVPPRGLGQLKQERPASRPRIEARSALSDRPGPRPGIGAARPQPVQAAQPRLERPRPQPAPRPAPLAQPGPGARPDRIGAGRPGLGQPARPAMPKAERPKAQRGPGQPKRDRDR